MENSAAPPTGADNTGFQSFARRYQAAFGAPPNRKATLAYDATSLAAGLTARFGNERFSDQVLTNPSGFIAAFKSVIGTTPSRYRSAGRTDDAARRANAVHIST